MRVWFAVILSASLVCAGCTHLALERRTVKQASTLTDLQYQQVLDNVAMFCCNKEALPWHLKLSGGLVQVADQGTATLNGAAGGTGDLANSISPTGTAQRGILGQWNVDPAVDTDDLEMLRLAYLKAVCPDDPDLVKKVDEKICELCIRFDLLPQKKTIKRILSTSEGDNEPEGVKELNRIINIVEGEIDAIGKKQSRLIRLIVTLNPDVPAAADIPTLMNLEEKLRDLRKDEQFKKEQKKVLVELLPPNGRRESASQSLPQDAFLRPQITIPGPKSSSVTLDDTSNTILLILTAMHAACPAGYLPNTDLKWEMGRNLGLVDQAEDKIKQLEDLLEKPDFNMPWFHCGRKKDVPKCACYVGHYCRCGRECYVWVMPDQMAALREFTLAVLNLAPNEAQDISSLVNPGRGAVFNPSIGC